ncbi:indolepyruvate ferredoxin oxidoreductase family protein [Patulibacter sp. SYSU D01012]|uniref:indolepyruvate ferredoxin oxidoreductase family protein n=1 Tax=Patulibacter sp. SYSU D01012 TaxID=2817381 RepID=UPI001B303E33|nr:indolepyruvate ferredoxin oxidoreductase family protein [Patulibacter sp. SYSU D01012]
MFQVSGSPHPLDVRRPIARPGVTLEDRYEAEGGPALMSGIQALVRSLLDVRRLDAARGRNTAVFVSGYQGSPLGGLDQELMRNRKRLDPAGIVFTPGINEELAATAVGGSQLLDELEGRRHDAVTGFWFGKSPGLDRAADAIRHANLAGTAPLGGAVAWIGDDPSSKSSTVPSSCEPICRSLHVPLLAPGTIEELLQANLHAVEMSRHAGCWTAVKIVADIADASATVDVGVADGIVPALPPREPHARPVLLPPTNLDAELDLMTARLDGAREYAAAAGLNRVVSGPTDRCRLAVVAAGVPFQSTLRALEDLGLDEAARDRPGIRLVQLMMPWPLDRDEIRRLTAGAETVLVVEDKLPFLETLVRDALYRAPHAPEVVGKEDADGRRLLTPRSALSADDVARALVHVLGDDGLPASAHARIAALDAPAVAGSPLPKRTPYFCSGCPHNTSTRADAGQLVGVGIGCHVMVALDGDRRGQLLGMPQMGGEGAQWIGLAPFTDDPHFVQNMGDGTFHHSGSLAVRAAVNAGVRMTFRLLYNDAVAMTGGQKPQGNIAIPDLTRWFALEGVRRVIVTTPEPDRYDGIALDPIATVRHRDEIADAQRELADVDGVTVLIHDDECATEKRRRRKRGLLTAPKQRIRINERVCEGCGDCGEKSSCLSVLPVPTEFGRKTQIQQSSCNQDFSCTKGDCPSFLRVTPGETAPAKRTPPALPFAPPDPSPRVAEDVLIRMPGVGGTGVVTTSQILQMAAHLDGRHAAGIEQTGLAQKGGPVLSDVRISPRPILGQLRASSHRADVLLGLDLLGAAAPDTLGVCDPRRTVAIVNTHLTPTPQQIIDPHAATTSPSRPLRRIRQATNAAAELTLDAGALAERLFGDHMPANMLLVGAAWQHGTIPIGLEAIEGAIRLNGAAVESNLAAFRWGRAAAANPEAVEAALTVAPPAPPETRAHRRGRALVAGSSAQGELRRLLEVRVPELVAFGGADAAREYLREVERVAAIERQRTGGTSTAVAEAYARGLHKLTAYKDEYEIARLHLDELERARTSEEFGPDAKVEILLLPPTLRSRGLKRKIALDGRWAYPVLRALTAGRRLRGTRMDPFGRAEIRRLERELPGEYRALVAAALEHLTADNAAQVAAIADLADVVRGYEDVKLRNVALFRERAARMLDDLAAGRVRKTTVELPMVRVG